MHDIDLNASPMATNDEDSYEDCMRQPLDLTFSNSISESSMIVKEPNSNVNASLSEEVLQKKNANDQDTMRYLDLNAPPLPIGDGNSCEDYMRNPLDMMLCETMGESDIKVNEHCFLNASRSKEVLQKKHANDEDTMRYLDLNAPPLPIGDGNSCEDYMRKPLDMMLCETMGGSSMMVNEHCFLNASRLKEVLQKNTNVEDVIPRFDLNVSHLFDNDDTPFEGRDYHVQQSSTLMHNLNTVSYKTIGKPTIIDEPNSNVNAAYGAFTGLDVPLNAFKHFHATGSSTACHSFDGSFTVGRAIDDSLGACCPFGSLGLHGSSFIPQRS